MENMTEARRAPPIAETTLATIVMVLSSFEELQLQLQETWLVLLEIGIPNDWSSEPLPVLVY